MAVTVLWDVTLCSLVYRCCFILRGRRMMCEGGRHFTLKMEAKRSSEMMLCIKLHGVTSQKIVIFVDFVLFYIFIKGLLLTHIIPIFNSVISNTEDHKINECFHVL